VVFLYFTDKTKLKAKSYPSMNAFYKIKNHIKMIKNHDFVSVTDI
jgi:hypothetical protein